MSKSKKILPELRFPEFKDSGEWDVKTLGEVLIKNSKKNKNQKYSQVESVSNKFGFIKQDEYFENRRVASKDTSNYYVIKKGYFAYNPSRIDVGSLAYKHNDEISIISPLYVSFKANKELINDYFLLSFFNSVTFTKQMIFEGGVRNTLNYDNLIQIKIPIPTIKEQQRIASCLSSLDEVIEAHSKKLELLKDHKKGLLQNLFPQKGETVPKVRFPEFEDDGEWVADSLVNIAKFRRGSFPQPYGLPEWYDDEDGMPFIQVYDVDDNFRLKPSTKRKISELAAEQSVFIEKGTVIITIQGSIGRVAITQYDAYIDRTLLIFQEFYNVIDRAFFAYTLFLLFEIEKQKAPGGIIKTITKQVLSDFTIKIPSLEEQQKIASCLSAVDELITAQLEKIEQLQQHKKGLMQGLFPKIND